MFSKFSEKIYVIIYLSSLTLFLLNFFVQSQIIFTYQDVLGLIFKMSWVYWLGFITLIILSYFHFSNLERLNEKYVYLTFIILTIYLIGTPFFYEHLPRFEDTWSHSFLAKEMFDKGKVMNKISGYEQYPGAFLFFGLLFQITPSYYVMQFFPLFFYTLGLIIIYMIFKHLFNSKISFLTSVLYIFFNWTVEDNHISPQFLMLFIYFLFMFLLIKLLSKKGKKKKLLVITLLFTIIIVFSHPGTPIFLLLIFGTMFILCKKFRYVLLLVSTFLLISFIIYHVYQITVLESYITMIKQFFQVLSSGTGFSRTFIRFSTGNLSRQIFISSRIGITIFSLILGVSGLFIAYKRGYKLGSKFFLSWAFSMALFIIFQSFVLRGELYERFVLISCLPLAALSAYLLTESRAGISILIILLIISPVFFIAKYGNEAFESESVEKLKSDCFFSRFDSDCEKRQEIVDSKLYFELLKYFGKIDYTVTREEIMSTSLFMNKSLEDVVNLIDSYSSDMKLDRIYSTNNAGVYR